MERPAKMENCRAILIASAAYTTCDAATSALTFNKRYTVAVAGFAGIHVARSLHIFRNDVIDEETIINKLKFPVFVKPNNGGSSIGMSK
jgi:D-alanine-D-alanine ligase